MSTLRLFVALETPGRIREALDRVLEELKAVTAEVRWENRDKLHATLKFLGETPEGAVDAILAGLERAAASAPPLTLSYSGLGFFPTPRDPRIIWAGIREPSGALNALHARIEGAMSSLGYPEESRPFHPHVTLGRVKGPRGLPALRTRIESCTFDQPPITLHEVALIKSDLRPSGSAYTTLKRISLSGNPDAGE